MATISGSRIAPSADFGSSHPYTCNTCQVAFRNSDLQRGHMRSDWHRYNLKRRVASLPPITSEVFTEKVLQARAATTEQAEKAGFERACETCNKTFFSENSFRNHLSSSKHKSKAAYLAKSSAAKVVDDASSMTFSLGEPAPTDSVVDSDAEEEFNEVVEGIKNTNIEEGGSPVKRPSNPSLSAAAQHQTEHPISEEESAATTPTTATPVPAQSAAAGPARSLETCLFCNYESPSADLNVNHMEKIHGMFIPEKQYLVNLEGLLNHLQERVFDLNECLTCYKVKANTYAVQTHMRDKSHCQIPYTTEDEQLEIGDFYDFRSTYSDGEGDEEDDWEDEGDEEGVNGGGAKLGAKRPSKLTTEDGDEVMAEDESWETDSDASSLDSNDLHAVPAENHYHQYDRLAKHPHHSRDTPRAHHQADGWHAISHKRPHAVFYDEYELHLPSGRSVGHRSLNKYFRQNLHNYPTPEEREERLAIEAAEAENMMDVDEEEETDPRKRLQLALRRATDSSHNSRQNQQLGASRETRGLGVALLGSKEAVAVVQKGRKKEWKAQKSRGFMQANIGIREVAAHPATYLR